MCYRTLDHRSETCLHCPGGIDRLVLAYCQRREVTRTGDAAVGEFARQNRTQPIMQDRGERFLWVNAVRYRDASGPAKDEWLTDFAVLYDDHTKKSNFRGIFSIIVPSQMIESQR